MINYLHSRDATDRISFSRSAIFGKTAKLFGPKTPQLPIFYTGEGYQIPKLCFIEQEFVHPLKTGSLKQIKHLIQFDRQPNHDLTETKEELYKISVSFPVQGEL